MYQINIDIHLISNELLNIKWCQNIRKIVSE